MRFYYRENILDSKDVACDLNKIEKSIGKGCVFINMCKNRYFFLLSYLLSIKICRRMVLPNMDSKSDQLDVLSKHPSYFILNDNFVSSCLDKNDCEDNRPLLIDSDFDFNNTIAFYTSGTTGKPKECIKNINELIISAQSISERLQLISSDSVLVATVPNYHMFGMEFTTLLCAHLGIPMVDVKPFFPADLIEILRKVAPKAVLVTTPEYLKACVKYSAEWPELKLIISATSPLSKKLACEVENKLGAPLIEIYGSTETGAIASRYTALNNTWSLLDDIYRDEDKYKLYSKRWNYPRLINDLVEWVSEREFILIGRRTDIIKRAGKRTSLSSLDNKLLGINKVYDGKYVKQGEDEFGDQLVVLVSGEKITAGYIREVLRALIDPIFMPRKIFILDTLPRNELGKIRSSDLECLLNLLNKT